MMADGRKYSRQEDGVAIRWLLRYAAPVYTVIRRHATQDRILVLMQFLKFGIVGTAGFLVDTAVVYALRHPIGLYAAGMVSYVVAATANWALNRVWTFRGRGSGPAHRQWIRFLLACLLGFVLNRGTYATLIATVPICASQPVLAVAAGSLAGMGVNFLLARAVVFR